MHPIHFYTCHGSQTSLLWPNLERCLHQTDIARIHEIKVLHCYQRQQTSWRRIQKCWRSWRSIFERLWIVFTVGAVQLRVIEELCWKHLTLPICVVSRILFAIIMAWSKLQASVKGRWPNSMRKEYPLKNNKHIKHPAAIYTWVQFIYLASRISTWLLSRLKLAVNNFGREKFSFHSDAPPGSRWGLKKTQTI